MDNVVINITELIDTVSINVTPNLDDINLDVSVVVDTVLFDVTQVVDDVTIDTVAQVDTVQIDIVEGAVLVVPGDYDIGSDWMALVRGYKVIPTFNATIVSGDVYDYVYETSGPDVTYYRYIASDGSIDGFYSMFDGSSVTDLIAEKKITI